MDTLGGALCTWQSHRSDVDVDRFDERVQTTELVSLSWSLPVCPASDRFTLFSAWLWVTLPRPSEQRGAKLCGSSRLFLAPHPHSSPRSAGVRPVVGPDSQTRGADSPRTPMTIPPT